MKVKKKARTLQEQLRDLVSKKPPTESSLDTGIRLPGVVKDRPARTHRDAASEAKALRGGLSPYVSEPRKFKDAVNQALRDPLTEAQDQLEADE